MKGYSMVEVKDIVIDGKLNKHYEEGGLTVLMSVWESLEAPYSRRYLPGISKEQQFRRKRIVHDILGKFGFPIERSYDTITIGRKGARAE
jgi:hypothetical protein